MRIKRAPRRRSKFHVDMTPVGRLMRTCHQCGRCFGSQAELRHDQTLHLLVAAGEVASYVPQKRVYLTFDDGTRIRPYEGKRDAVCVVDFLVEYPDGHLEAHDVKGKKEGDSRDPDARLWMLKYAIVARMHPEWTIRIIR